MKRRSLCELLSLKGKTTLITGSAHGIGRAAAYRFAEAGSNLYLVDIDGEALERVVKEIRREYGVVVESFIVDLSKKSDIDMLWYRIKGREPDILINNAGIYVFKEFTELDEKLLEKTMKVNFEATLWMSKYMISSRKNRGGVIINVGSIEAILPFAKGLAHYDSSKAAVIALTRALAREYGRLGFRVNVVVPGGIETETVKKLKREAILKMRKELIESGRVFEARLPMGRMGDPDEVARVMVFLASDLASYINGAIIPVDGGFLSA